MSKAIHAFPGASLTWAFAAELLTAYPHAAPTHANSTGNDNAVFTILARSAMAVKGLVALDNPGYTVSLRTVGELLSGCHTDATRTFLNAKIAVHENPASPDTCVG